ncbi:SUKH-3 domain-containing protein [Pseudomonas sp. KU26590]|uniref:SUKH-3 domain-containing protein n=1 Tax=Pseudomonas sp. KU26590 TaxID=2991051 RepID=UPI00223D163C|nr:SUKH-3 domain-containing protein [Pseudomonas sp. KU26590]UZJ58489.1 SUKH-3 domain-containing protein [Pseudomonas sp. KU26590]
MTDTLNVPPLIELPESLSPLFLAAGWPSTSTVPLPRYVPHDHPAAALLKQLAGVQVGICGAGEECATSDVAFGTFEHLHESEDFLEWEQRLGTTLVSIAEVHHGHGALLIDEKGCCYLLSLIHDGLWIQGLGFVQAMENLIFGRKTGEQAQLATPGAIPIFFTGTL